MSCQAFILRTLFVVLAAFPPATGFDGTPRVLAREAANGSGVSLAASADESSGGRMAVDSATRASKGSTRPTASATPASPPATQPTRSVRCAVIGGMMETEFWPALAQRFERDTGIAVELVGSGPKEDIVPVFRDGKADLIVMHASDAILNLVADGLAIDPQPWARNDMILVGPADDPAGVKGERDAAAAFNKIVKSKSNVVVHSSLGAQEVLHSILARAGVTLLQDRTTVLLEDRQRLVLQIASEKKAYTLVGRIPFRNGKLPNAGLVAMVQGDPSLRRPYLVAVANPHRIQNIRVVEARSLAGYLRQPATQAWIAGFGKGVLDGAPIFYPVEVDPAEEAGRP